MAVADGFKGDVRPLDAVIKYPTMTDPHSGERIPALRRLERRVARMYRRETAGPIVGWFQAIDWAKVLIWLKSHLAQILVLVAAIIPFVI
jgi:hypothetical protein